MDESFWLNRWRSNEIGFHNEKPHHYLLRCFDALTLHKGMRCFVPFCGKSPDLVWLHAQGLQVVGIELSRLAIEAFEEENRLTGAWTTTEGLRCYRSGAYQLFCGNFFELSPKALSRIHGVYDRGSLVALPRDMRAQYADQLIHLTPAGSRMLLISYEYDQDEANGPPFSVPIEEIESLYGCDFELSLLAEEDALWSHQALADRGLSRLKEYALLLVRK